MTTTKTEVPRPKSKPGRERIWHKRLRALLKERNACYFETKRSLTFARRFGRLEDLWVYLNSPLRGGSCHNFDPAVHINVPSWIREDWGWWVLRFLWADKDYEEIAHDRRLEKFPPSVVARRLREQTEHLL